MPSRPSSHQLEDRSLREFEALLPDPWVARRVTPDYGIDLELELFGDDGNATGLTFLVQMRATDNSARAHHLDLRLDQLAYYEMLGRPVILVRYDASTRSFRWRWVSSLDGATAGEAQQTIRVHFGEADIWTEATPVLIARSLTTRKILASYPQDQPVGFAITPQCGLDLAYRLETVVDRLLSNVPVLRRLDGDNEACFFRITVEDERILFDLAGVASHEESIADSAISVGDFLYPMSALLYRHGLVSHAAQLATRLVGDELAHPNKDLALAAANALEGSLVKSVRLAVINGLHHAEDPSYMQYLLFLRGRPHDRHERVRAFENFMSHAINHSLEQRRARVAAHQFFSLATFLNMHWRPLIALHWLNRARKLWPDYLEQPHFLIEMASSMFNLTRFRCAAALYGRAVDDESEAKLRVYHADALLFSGDIERARERFSSAIDIPFSENSTPSSSLALEAELKVRLCDWLIDRLGATHFAGDRSTVVKLMKGTPASGGPMPDLARTVYAADPTDGWANFNLAFEQTQLGNIRDSFWHFLMTVIGNPLARSAWSNMLASGYLSQDPDLLYLGMAYAALRHGHEPYKAFRHTMRERGLPDEVLAAIDNIQRDFMEMSRRRYSEPLVFRAFGEIGFQTHEVTV